jgi:hypothetical protein
MKVIECMAHPYEELCEWYAKPLCISVSAIASVRPIAVEIYPGREQPTEWPKPEVRTMPLVRMSNGEQWVIVRGPCFEEIVAMMRQA